MNADAQKVKLSAYVLTKNSEHLLKKVLAPLKLVADEVMILDSGSSDSTLEIARAAGCRIEVRAFDDFARQRQAAQDLCNYDFVLFVDSDEIMSDDLVSAVLAEKSKGFPHSIYSFRRQWNVLGRNIRALYPVVCPDYPARLLDRRKANFHNSAPVHECPVSVLKSCPIEATLFHITFPTQTELDRKLHFYARLVGVDVVERKKPIPARFIVQLRAGFAFIKWYFFKGSFLDGRVGFECGRYGARYTSLKYEYARGMLSDQSHQISHAQKDVLS